MHTTSRVFIILSFLVLFISCSTNRNDQMIKENNYGKLADGREVTQFILTNKSGSKLGIINYGARATHLLVKDKDGKLEDVILGYDTIEGYESDNSFQGAIVGRYGNRIGEGKFSIDGQEYQLDINDGKNSLHGGSKGFFSVLWNGEVIETPDGPAVKLSYVSPDGEMGYPGTVSISVTYTLTDNNEVKIEYEGTTDKPTILNPTHHSYFNISGDFTQKITDELLQINAEKFTPVNETLIPTGELADVAGTPMDFRKAKLIGQDINADYEQLKIAGGYDHNWVLDSYNKMVRKVAEVYDPNSGRVMEVFTDQPGIQFYSGNFLDGSIIGKDGIKYNHRTALCLETQFFPDSPNHSNFPSPILRPGEKYTQTTIYKFSVK